MNKIKTLRKTVLIQEEISATYVVFDGETIPDGIRGSSCKLYIQDHVLIDETVSGHNGDISTKEVRKGQVIEIPSFRIYNSEDDFLKVWKSRSYGKSGFLFRI